MAAVCKTNVRCSVAAWQLTGRAWNLQTWGWWRRCTCKDKTVSSTSRTSSLRSSSSWVASRSRDLLLPPHAMLWECVPAGFHGHRFGVLKKSWRSGTQGRSSFAHSPRSASCVAVPRRRSYSEGMPRCCWMTSIPRRRLHVVPLTRCQREMCVSVRLTLCWKGNVQGNYSRSSLSLLCRAKCNGWVTAKKRKRKLRPNDCAKTAPESEAPWESGV